MKKLAIAVTASVALLMGVAPSSAAWWHRHHHHHVHFVWVGDAVRYDNPYYFWSPRTIVDHVETMRSIEVGPTRVLVIR